MCSVAMVHDAQQAGQAAAAKAKAWLNQPNFHQLTQVAVGARVIDNTTVSKKKPPLSARPTAPPTAPWAQSRRCSWGSGLPGDRRQPWVEKLKVRLDSNQREVTVSRTKVETTHKDGCAFSKRTFPLLLAYAMTAHRCQGATLPGRVILHVRSAFAPAIVYVMLSRATKRANVRVLGELHPHHFVPVNEAAFRLWAQRQRQQPQLPVDSGDSDDEDTSDEEEQDLAGW